MCTNNYTDLSVLAKIPDRSFVDAGLFPNILGEFKRHIGDLRDLFKLKNQFVMEAKQMLV